MAEVQLNHEMSELELYRKDVVFKSQEIELLKRNIADQQYEIHTLQMRVKELSDENINISNELGVANERIRHLTGNGYT